ncbi:glyceraldehyde-3-phosphate dehydrogenase [Olivibacter sp. SDN3]|uniref:glyceraldehyde-3-phosphate dehydrogenase n=1 Tax=Olivibacter sp. SDN3 TaxID=2764720 RepID=UPI001650F366|nr:glyceraldehyde-3-phosphate dehydrogenase [Olivibacter sp. SDN3]QNL48495.1 glyceraldehyde-3-phosphate dehydrogenase [Olivibacter sp. SDN3]
MTNKYQSEFNSWIEKEKQAIELIGIVGQLWFERSIELVLFRSPLFDVSSSQILATHQYAREISNKDISIYDTLDIAKAIKNSNIAPSRIDVGKLLILWVENHQKYSSVHDFVIKELAKHIGKGKKNLRKRDVILYGFGRIGRLLAREIITQTGKGEQLRLRAIVIRGNDNDSLQKRADLLAADSIHNRFKGTVSLDTEHKTLIINGQRIHLISSEEPDKIDYTKYGITHALLIDNTGAYRDRANLSRHLKAKGVEKILLTAPAKDDVPNVVSGINEHTINLQDEHIFSCASCTTNAIVPVLNLVDNLFQIRKGHIETVHAYTNDQNLLDNYHKKARRGRAAPLNMVITETGSEKAVAKVLPSLAGKLTSNAVRVPVPNVSLAILNLTTNRTLSLKNISESLKHAALFGDFSEQIDYSISKELVSSDVIGNSHAAIIDGPATIVSKDSKSVILYIWYDNEYGYSRQVIRFAKKIAGVVRLTYY